MSYSETNSPGLEYSRTYARRMLSSIAAFRTGWVDDYRPGPTTVRHFLFGNQSPIAIPMLMIRSLSLLRSDDLAHIAVRMPRHGGVDSWAERLSQDIGVGRD
jgi:hypothetical protein